jgi:hypothetical protein
MRSCDLHLVLAVLIFLFVLLLGPYAAAVILRLIAFWGGDDLNVDLAC